MPHFQRFLPSTKVSQWASVTVDAPPGAVYPKRAWGGLISQYETGGTTYRVHTFRGSGTFEVSGGAIDVTYLIVGGGGGGGAGNPGAGGGAGGIRSGTTTLASGTNYSIVVGKGGRSAWYTYGPYGNGDDARKGEDGVDSSAFSVTADGGGGGAGFAGDYTGRPGGSGGGGAVANNTGADANAGGAASGGGTGNAGGTATLAAHSGWEYASAGGGGAGAAGGNAHGGTGGDSNTGADGGAGASGIGITSATAIYAGGGAGSDYPYGDQNYGGSSIGGMGTITSNGPGFAGVPNTGSGSGGGHYSAERDGTLGRAGSGIVVIRYEVS